MLLCVVGQGDDVEREIDRSVHPFLLRSPSRAEDRIRRAGRVLDRAGLHLREKSAEVADQVGALEVGRQALERLAALALWTSAMRRNKLLAAFAGDLFRGRHSLQFGLERK